MPQAEILLGICGIPLTQFFIRRKKEEGTMYIVPAVLGVRLHKHLSLQMSDHPIL